MMHPTFFINGGRGLLLGFVLCCQAMAGQAVTVEAFGLRSSPFRGDTDNVSLCYLDGGQGRLAAVNRTLAQHPHTPHAELIARHLADFQALSEATVCRYRAKALGVTRLPTVVFDGQFAVVGVRDLAVARQDYADYRQEGQQ